MSWELNGFTHGNSLEWRRHLASVQWMVTVVIAPGAGSQRSLPLWSLWFTVSTSPKPSSTLHQQSSLGFCLLCRLMSRTGWKGGWLPTFTLSRTLWKTKCSKVTITYDTLSLGNRPWGCSGSRFLTQQEAVVHFSTIWFYSTTGRGGFCPLF